MEAIQVDLPIWRTSLLLASAVSIFIPNFNNLNMETLYQSEFLLLEHDKDKHVLHFTWLPATENMDEPDYQRELEKYAQIVEQHKITAVLIDDRAMGFVVAPELQVWLGTEIFPIVAAAGLARYAVLLNEDMIAKLALEQAAAETPEGMLYRFFENKEKALNWLIV
ncbi:MAG: hypothetical protein JJT94_13155 [Bernardetiaceae bacterium]|nr:hypothetical protein [Bernardetiaceae bacterium]